MLQMSFSLIPVTFKNTNPVASSNTMAVITPRHLSALAYQVMDDGIWLFSEVIINIASTDSLLGEVPHMPEPLPKLHCHPYTALPFQPLHLCCFSWIYALTHSPVSVSYTHLNGMGNWMLWFSPSDFLFRFCFLQTSKNHIPSKHWHLFWHPV